MVEPWRTGGFPGGIPFEIHLLSDEEFKILEKKNVARVV